MAEAVVEGSQNAEPTDAEKSAGNVPLTKYIGVKEMLGKREASLAEATASLEQIKTQLTAKETELTNLGEQLKVAQENKADPEQIKALVGERDAAKAEVAQMKKETLLKENGIKPEDVEGMNDEQIQAFIKGRGRAVKPDLGTGTAATGTGTGFERMRAGFDALHPSGK